MMEVWEVASALGEATIDIEEWHSEYSRLERESEEAADPLGVTSSAVKYGGADLLAQRVAASKGEAPLPEARVMSTLETANLMGQLNG